MSKAYQDDTDVVEYQKVREYWRQHTTLFGLIKWYRSFRVDVLEEEIYIHTKNAPPYIRVNNIKYVPEQPREK